MGNLRLHLGLNKTVIVGSGRAVSVAEVYKETLGTSTAAVKTYDIGVTPEAGDLLLYLFWLDGVGFTTHTPTTPGWIELYDGAQSFIMYKIATGDELPTDTVTFTAAASGARSSGLMLRIPGGAVPTMGSVVTSGRDPASFSPAGGEDNYAWITAIAYKRQEGMGDAEGVATWPTGWTENTAFSQNYLPDTPNASSGGRGGIGVSHLVESATLQDPGVITMDGAAVLNNAHETYVIATSLAPALTVPTVVSITPDTSVDVETQSVVIVGTDFSGATAVTIGGAACTSVAVDSNNQITCNAPVGTGGTASVLVTTPLGTNPANTLYTYLAIPTVVSIAPTSGLEAGGEEVVLTGTNFTGATGVTIGGSACTSVVVDSDTQITCDTPSGSSGAVSVLVTNTDGTNDANTLYTYTVAATDRAVFGGGVNTGARQDRIDYITIPSTGNATDFGNLIQARSNFDGYSSATRGCFVGGFNAGRLDVIDYITIATLGNAIDFGNLSTARNSAGCGSNGVRGVAGGGSGLSGAENTIDYVTIASTGNATDFGDLLAPSGGLVGLSNNIRVCFSKSASANDIEYATIASTGNSIVFGDLVLSRANMAGAASTTRGLWAGGTGFVNNIDYITIASTGDATDFGNLTVGRDLMGGTSTKVRAVFGGGQSDNDTIDYVTIASTGNATNFGNLTMGRSASAAVSDSHGGI